MHSGTLAHALDRLAHTARVLYIAAHPDDENTRLLAYLANQRHVTAAYLSLTRGGGGQNLIGAEQGDLLDVIRTEELLAARRLDGARQYFTRMRDFGFSKSADETLAIWNHEEALADVVWILRVFQPDIVITRFDERPPNHGHHTASAILAREAFAAAGDARRFPEQLVDGVRPWQAERLLHNLSHWRPGPTPEGALPIDVGAYDSRLGLGYGELAALSRSQHKSQGFGAAGERGPIFERFVHVAGSAARGDLFDGIDLSWTRYGAPGARLAEIFARAQAHFAPEHPERIVPHLIEAAAILDDLPDDSRVRDARDQLRSLLLAASGLFMRATAARPTLAPGAEVAVHLEVALGTEVEVQVGSLTFPGRPTQEPHAPLRHGTKLVFRDLIRIDPEARASWPYWLAAPPLAGRHDVADRKQVGAPRAPAPLSVAVELRLGGHQLRVDVPVQHAWVDRVHGERLREVAIVPPLTITPLRQAVLLVNGNGGALDLRLRAGRDAVRARITLPLPTGWRSEPEQHDVDLEKVGDETTVRFVVHAPQSATPLDLELSVDVDGRRWSAREDVIDYPHIPVQLVLQPARIRLAPLEVNLPSGMVGYLPGSGDSVAEDLAHVGVRVVRIDETTLATGDLSRFTAIIAGIRAYNTQPALARHHARLIDYVAGGGTYLVQYNTSSEGEPLRTPIGPYPFVVGRGRVTDERAAVEAIRADEPLLRWPHAIGPSDFDGWVQERGLYFAEHWDERYRPVLRLADPGETAQEGAVLEARHGRGRYVYTGLAFFRQLPAGVIGAYRLFLNLIAGSTP